MRKVEIGHGREGLELQKKRGGGIKLTLLILHDPKTQAHLSVSILNYQALQCLTSHSSNCRLWVHIFMMYVFTLWACYVLYTEYQTITIMRLHFLASQCRSVDQFTVRFSNAFELLV